MKPIIRERIFCISASWGWVKCSILSILQRDEQRRFSCAQTNNPAADGSGIGPFIIAVGGWGLLPLMNSVGYYSGRTSGTRIRADFNRFSQILCFESVKIRFFPWYPRSIEAHLSSNFCCLITTS